MTTKIAHTPGPWEVNQLGSRLFVEDWPSSGKAEDRAEMALCCEIHGMNDDCLYPVDFHNARLIAAAPELYEACRLLMQAERMQTEGARDGGTMGTISSAIDAARAALAKVQP